MQIFAYVLQTVVLLLSFFMIVLILLQRGRGGGLAGAFGGAGGQSAFGAKAGDAFTRITVVVALLWAITAGICGIVMRKANAEGGRAAGLAEEKVKEDKKDGELKNLPSTGGGKADGATAPPSGTTAPATQTGPVTPAAPEGEKPAAPDATPAPAATEPAAPAAETKPAEPATDKPAAPRLLRQKCQLSLRNLRWKHLRLLPLKRHQLLLLPKLRSLSRLERPLCCSA